MRDFATFSANPFGSEPEMSAENTPSLGITSASSAGPSMRRGHVKQVLSGDAVVIQGQGGNNGPPPEATVYLSNVTAPRLAKRPTDTNPGTPDEPWAWEAREYLRKKLIGQFVVFLKDFTATSSRDHGRILLGGSNSPDQEIENFEPLQVELVELFSEYTAKLLELQEKAKAAKVGRWSDITEGCVRDVKWIVSDPRALVDHYKQKPIDAVIEMVRDGSTVRAFLLPNFEMITLQLSGIRSPSTRPLSDGTVEIYAEEAKFFVEQRLLQQDVQIILESTSNANFVGSILHPRGNIAESLLREGFAKCVDWSIGLCTGGAEKLRAAESQAKEKRMRLWRNYAATASNLSEKKKFEAKVLEVVLNDQLVVLRDDGEELKIHLSSIRLPREANDSKPAPNRQFRALYDVPFMYEARELLRKKLIGKRVQVTIDYLQPKSDQFAEKTCCTVEHQGKNIAEGLLERGLCKVVRHRNDDENRSSQYDKLLAAEAKAEKEKKGLFADKVEGETNTQRVQELQADLARSKQYLPHLQKRASSRPEGVVDYIASGSRIRIYIPKENILITFLLGGINCPKGARAGANGQAPVPAEPFADEAARFTKRLVLQREVELEVEGLDKTGSFIGYLWVKPDEGGRPQNLSELLLEQGLALLHFTAEKSSHYNQLSSAETRAKEAKRNLWANWTDPSAQEAAEEKANERTDRSISYKKVVVTDIQKGGTSFRFAAQSVEDGPKLEKLMAELRTSLKEHPPVLGSFNPKRGELVAAPFSADGQWYRAKIESLKHGQADVFFLDYGNRETMDVAKLAPLPHGMTSFPAAAREYCLALVIVPSDAEYAAASLSALEQLVFRVPHVEVNSEYRQSGLEYVQVIAELNGQKLDIAKTLLEDGFALVDRRREPRLKQLVEEYADAEKKARRERCNIWEFGDFTGIEI